MASHNNRSYRIVFYLVPSFSMIAFSSAIEPLRLANRVLGRSAYHWQVITADGGPVRASNGVLVNVDGSLSRLRSVVSKTHLRPAAPARLRGEQEDSDEKIDLVLVCAGIGVEKFSDVHLYAWLRRMSNQGVNIGGLCNGSWVLATAGLLKEKRCVIHWENMPGFQEKFPETEVFPGLYEQDGNIYSAAGGTASLDLILNIIGEHFGLRAVTDVSEQCIVDRVRTSRDRQRMPLRARLGIRNSKLLLVVELMEANISEPLTLAEISHYAGLSRRHIERLFLQYLQRSPARYYLDLRLERARQLLLQSDIPVVEVAVACGFVSASHFSKCYKEAFGSSPQVDRATSNFPITA